jgi:hypothetical protein
MALVNAAENDAHQTGGTIVGDAAKRLARFSADTGISGANRFSILRSGARLSHRS